jgi:hypothetical protein
MGKTNIFIRVALNFFDSLYLVSSSSNFKIKNNFFFGQILKNKRIVLAYGESTAQMSGEDSWPSQLERNLNSLIKTNKKEFKRPYENNFYRK